MVNNTPVKKFSAGSISVALFENSIVVSGQTKKVLKASVGRRYRDNKTGEWKSSQSFSRNEIPLVVYCLQKAFDSMMEDAQEANSSEDESLE